MPPDWRPDAATEAVAAFRRFSDQSPPTAQNREKNPAVKRGWSIKRSGVCVSVSALRATTTPAHPAISLVRHRVRFASTSAALRSTAPAALKRLQRSGPARFAVGLSSIQGKTPPSTFGLRPVFPLCLPSAAIHPFFPQAVMLSACSFVAAQSTPAPDYPTSVQ